MSASTTIYIATDTNHNSIMGLGSSREAAALDADTCGGNSDAAGLAWDTYPATARLVTMVEDRGGETLQWEVVDGMADLVGEA